MPVETSTARVALGVSGALAAAAAGWLVVRTALGLDLADEMQYYGQIASLARSGRFFEDDLFVQQLGYFFLYPFFRLHVLLFPDLDHLVFCCRVLLLAAYAATGWLFWRSATRSGGQTLAQRLAGLGIFLAWIPFQLFAFSYNTNSYLLIVAILSVWLGRAALARTRYNLFLGVLLAALVFTHPSAGIALILLAAAEALTRDGRREFLLRLGTIAAAGLVIFGLMVALHGPSFPRYLLAALQFSAHFNVGGPILYPGHLQVLAILAAAGALFVFRCRCASAFPFPSTDQDRGLRSWTVLLALVAGAAALIKPMQDHTTAYPAMVGFLGLLLAMAGCLIRPSGARWLSGLTAGLLTVGIVILLWQALGWGTYLFSTAVFLVLLIILGTSARTAETPVPADLAIIGLVLGTAYAITSSNGINNFNLGTAAVVPFLMLHAAGSAGRTGAVFVPGIGGLLLLNGLLHPYGEQPILNRFVPVTTVPAFRGIRTSAEKLETIRLIQEAAAPLDVRGRRMLVVGPQPWIYFALPAKPATSMLFMHSFGLPTAYQIVANRMDRRGPPEVIVVTSPSVPPPIAEKIKAWTRLDTRCEVLRLPPGLIGSYRDQVGYEFAPEIRFLVQPMSPAEAPSPPR